MKEKNKLNQKTLFKSSNFKNSFSIKPKIAVLRDQGINGQVEMSAAFSKAGFKVYDVHMTDLKNNFLIWMILKFSLSLEVFHMEMFLELVEVGQIQY